MACARTGLANVSATEAADIFRMLLRDSFIRFTPGWLVVQLPAGLRARRYPPPGAGRMPLTDGCAGIGISARRATENPAMHDFAWGLPAARRSVQPRGKARRQAVAGL